MDADTGVRDDDPDARAVFVKNPGEDEDDVLKSVSHPTGKAMPWGTLKCPSLAFKMGAVRTAWPFLLIS